MAAMRPLKWGPGLQRLSFVGITGVSGTKSFSSNFQQPPSPSSPIFAHLSSILANKNENKGTVHSSLGLNSDSSPSNVRAAKIKRELLFPLSSVVDSDLVYSAGPGCGHDKEGHPECKARVTAIMNALAKEELTHQHRRTQLLELDVKSEALVDDLAAVHAMSYLKGLKKIMAKAKDEKLIILDSTGPTYATQHTYTAAMLAASASLSVVDHVVIASRETRCPPVGFALVRPPGHHALATRPMGFCVFGNIAVAAKHVQKVHGLERVFIIDFDVHHGNGTSDIFYEDPTVFYLSTHQIGGFPGTGKMDEVGEGAGEGTTLNVPLPGGSGDAAMAAVFDKVIVPAAQKFRPDIILVSAGYDAHVLDDLAGLQFTTGTYYRLAYDIKRLSRELCGGRCCFFLEGGYNLKALSNSVVETFRGFLGLQSESPRLDNPAILYDEPGNLVKQAINEIRAIHSLR